MMTVCLVHFGLDFGLVVRYLAGEYTAAWRNVDLILDDTHPHVSAETLEHMRRLLTRGAPANFNWEEPAANKLNFTRCGNSSSLIQHPVALKKALVKEVRNSNLMPMARWACTCSAFGHHVPQHIGVQKGGKPRLIWNSTTKEDTHDITTNEMTGTDNEAEITFGYVYMAFYI